MKVKLIKTNVKRQVYTPDKLFIPGHNTSDNNKFTFYSIYSIFVVNFPFLWFTFHFYGLLSIFIVFFISLYFFPIF